MGMLIGYLKSFSVSVMQSWSNNVRQSTLQLLAFFSQPLLRFPQCAMIMVGVLRYILIHLFLLPGGILFKVKM